MPNKDDIAWFKQQFRSKIEAAIQGTPFSLNMLAALACQETGEIWPVLRKKQLGIDTILELCVGDTIDKTAKGGRNAFPKTKSDLVARPNGEAMFAIARKALLDMSQYITSYQGVAQKPNKFCHGYGIFQYDLQFFLQDPDYFLNKQYADFDACLAKCLGELNASMRRIGWQQKTKLTDFEMAAVVIAYNTGRFKPALGLKQGYKPKHGKYYGEQFFDYLRLAHIVEVDVANNITITNPVAGLAVVSSPSLVESTGEFFIVDVITDPLRLRKEPRINPQNPRDNVMATMPDGHIVRAVTGTVVNKFLEVETSLLGAHFRGFAAVKNLKPATHVTDIPVDVPQPVSPGTGIVAVYMPRKEALVTKRKENANAHSLNEQGQPGREGNSPEELRTELAKIIDWLEPGNPKHLRYQPRGRLTFCNIYAHDYCFLAGVYLPRVWWTQSAIRLLAQGQTVEPLYDKTIDEQRANDLFRWLRDFGLEFGWRRTGTLTKLQTEVNQGAIGIIVARQKNDGLSGHIVAVVPETEEFRATRNAAGEVTAPLQSQAGRTNFSYGTGRPNWWRGAEFAESAFWIHP
jgi:hypothetical protein